MTLPPWRETLERIPQAGRVRWIGLRPARGAAVAVVQQAEARAGRGLQGDRYRGSGGRQVTLLQAEHLAVIAALAGSGPVEPQRLRRNLLVEGLNLLALRGRRFRVGAALLEFSGLCHPCTRMETALGPGGLNAMRGHGGINARILESGTIRVGDPVTVVPD